MVLDEFILQPPSFCLRVHFSGGWSADPRCWKCCFSNKHTWFICCCFLFFFNKCAVNVCVFFHPSSISSWDPRKENCLWRETCILIMLPSGKLAWQWKSTFSNRKYIFKWWIFHCYVSFLEGILCLFFWGAASKIHALRFIIWVDQPKRFQRAWDCFLGKFSVPTATPKNPIFSAMPNIGFLFINPLWMLTGFNTRTGVVSDPCCGEVLHPISSCIFHCIKSLTYLIHKKHASKSYVLVKNDICIRKGFTIHFGYARTLLGFVVLGDVLLCTVVNHHQTTIWVFVTYSKHLKQIPIIWKLPCVFFYRV